MLWVEGEMSSIFFPVKICLGERVADGVARHAKGRLVILVSDDRATCRLCHRRSAPTHVNGDKVDLGVTVLARLGGGHVDDLARATLDDDVTVLAKGRALHPARVSGGGTESGPCTE
jgi:hypothetical protein